MTVSEAMGRNVLQLLILAFLLCDPTNGRVKDPDEDKAYEFGFTIEGMQHRHEKKDVNGIIQGEFGFITADGVYHVTVYATDENGNFRIISMKNIKVSPPLDGSPDFGSTKYSPIPKGPQDKSTPLKAPLQPEQVQKRKQQSITRSPNKDFTTQPTLKPACAGCGYVTTTQKPLVSSNNYRGSPGGFGSAPVVPQGGISTPNDVSYSNGGGRGYGGTVSTSLSNVNSKHGGSTFGTSPDLFNRFGDSTGGIPGGAPSFSGAPSTGSIPEGPSGTSDRFGGTIDINFQPGSPGGVSSYSDSFSNPNKGQKDIPGKPSPIKHSSPITNRNPESPVKVTNGVIQIPGNPDIPIKDKYPGMVDGLPAGIEQKDITDILYRFNWTVGFQGHYETGYKNGAKVGGYFVNGSDGISRVVTYVADEFGYRPKVKFINIGLDSPDTPKDDKTFELKSFEFVWYPVK